MADHNSDSDTTEEYEETERDGEEYEVERLATREEGAAALRRLADGVANGSVTLGDEAEVTVPERFELEIEYEQEADEAELEAELEWPIVNGEAAMAEDDSEVDDDSEAAVRDNENDEDEEESVAEAADERSIDEVIGGGDAASNAQFELYRDRADEWRWRLVHDNGNIIADSGEGYNRKATARNGLESVMRNAPGATVVETGD